MQSEIRTGRIVGALLLLLIIGGILTNFVLTESLFGEPGFLIAAAGNASKIALSALVGVAMGLVSIGFASLLYPVFRQRSQTLGLYYFALVVAGFALTVVENISVMSLLSLSQAYAEAGGATPELFDGLRIVVKSARNWTHYIGLIVSGCSVFVFYVAMFRFRLIPRWLSVIGLLTVCSQLYAVSTPLFGIDVDFRFIAPLGICQIVLAFWLMVRGFRGKAP
jgi:Domain of unknown function (DUF4386)